MGTLPMEPRPLPQSWSSHWHPTIARYTTPCNGTTSTPPKLVVTLPNHSTLQWHPTMAPSNGTTSTAPCNGTLVPRPIRQSDSSPSPPIGSKNPYSYRYLGNNHGMIHDLHSLRPWDASQAITSSLLH